MNNYEKSVFISDIHCPFEDSKALAVMYKFIKDFKPSTVFILGDLLDCYAISRFTKDPKGKLNFKQEIESARRVLKEIRSCSGNAKIYYLRGNHCLRMQRYLWNRAEELSGLSELEIPHLLQLDKLNIEWVEKGMMMYHGIMVKHGSIVRQYSGYSAKAEYEKNGCSGVSAHTHRANIYYHSNSGGEFQWMETGCLCKLEQEYMEGEKANWKQSFGVGYFKGNDCKLELVTINKGKAFYQGKEYN